MKTQRYSVTPHPIETLLAWVKSGEIAIPEIQREIVARIESERAIIHGNRELIRLYEEKVKKVIERVWANDGR